MQMINDANDTTIKQKLKMRYTIYRKTIKCTTYISGLPRTRVSIINQSVSVQTRFLQTRRGRIVHCEFNLLELQKFFATTATARLVSFSPRSSQILSTARSTLYQITAVIVMWLFQLLT